MTFLLNLTYCFIIYFSFLSLYTATLAEWNVVVYGTKEAPEANKNRAAVSLPPPPPPTLESAQTAVTLPPPTLTIPAVMQPQPKMMVEPQPPAEDRQWSDVGGGSDRKSSQHTNNVEQKRGASPFPPPPPQQQQPAVVTVAAVDQPVVMSSSSSSSVRCRPGHWDSAAAVCLSTCLLIFHLLIFRDQCHLPPPLHPTLTKSFMIILTCRRMALSASMRSRGGGGSLSECGFTWQAMPP